MEPEGSLPHSQVPATCSYPELARSSSHPTSYFLKIRLNIILPSTPGRDIFLLEIKYHLLFIYLFIMKMQCILCEFLASKR